MSGILTTIGTNVRFYRKQLGLSQEQLAESSGLHRTYIGSVERGERNISALNIEKIAVVLGVEPAKLLEIKLDIANHGKKQSMCKPISVNSEYFNHHCKLPYGLDFSHINQAMNEFIDFLDFLNEQFLSKYMASLESFLMPANFSSIVGEFMNMSIPKYCKTLVKNQYHNGHPDLIPADTFAKNAVQYSDQGIEIKASRHKSGWQGHNPESVWIMVFCFDSNTSSDAAKNVADKPFIFHAVYAAKLEESDWTFSGRSETSRRTITASVNRDGFKKMTDNWIYKLPS